MDLVGVGCTRGQCLGCVGEQVQEDLLELGGVAAYGRQLLVVLYQPGSGLDLAPGDLDGCVEDSS